jgi:YHS domain-containing protein
MILKKALFALLIAVSAISAFAGPNKTKTPKTIVCAVTGGKVDIAKATKDHMYTDYKGRRYFFCCAGCPEEFNKDKAKYSKSPSIETPKDKKPAKAAK